MLYARCISAEPKKGHELAYGLAWKHREGYAKLFNQTPWWQFRKKERKFKKYTEAIRRVHLHGQDRIERIL